MPDVTFFSPEDSERIAEDVRWGDGIRNRGVFSIDNPVDNLDDLIYAKLTVRDPDGIYGFYEAEEAVYRDTAWEILDGGRKFNSTDYAYVRHYNYDNADIGKVVRLFRVQDIEGVEDFVFFNEVTNPEAFVLHSVESGGTAGSNESAWEMREGGSVLTNVGTLDLKPFLLQPGLYLGVAITFIDIGAGFQLAGAGYTINDGDYWTENKTEGTIVINHPIANLDLEGDKCRLRQHHAGDIHLEVFGFSEDPDDPDDPTPYTRPINIVGDGHWINVTKQGRTFTVAHILPNPELPKNVMKGLDKAFSCDAVAFGTLQDAEDWANTLISAIQQLQYDVRGHVINLLDCAGAPVDPVYDPDDPGPPGDDPVIYNQLTSTLSSVIQSAPLVPKSVDGDSGINVDYKIFKNLQNFLDYINVKNINIGVTNDKGEFVQSDIDNDGAFLDVHTELAVNNAGTSGWIGDIIPDDYLRFSTFRFRFNATVELAVATNGLGLRQTVSHNTASNSVVVTPDDTIIKDKDDPDVTAFGFIAGYLIGDLGPSPYKVQYSFTYADDTPVLFSNSGAGGPFTTGVEDLSLDATSTTPQVTGIYFDIKDGIEPGQVIKLCTSLVTNDAEEYNANVDDCELLSFNTEDDCISDGTGENVSDGVEDCITDNTPSSIVALSTAICTHPGSGTISATALLTSGTQTGSNDDFVSVKSTLDDSAAVLINPGLTAGYRNNFGGSAVTSIQRRYLTMDTLGITEKISCRIVWSSNQTNRKFIIVYTTDVEPAVSNVTFDMPTWTVLGSINNPTSSSETIDFDCDSLPRNTDLRVGIMTINDFENDVTGMTGVNIPTNGFRLGSIIFYKCP